MSGDFCGKKTKAQIFDFESIIEQLLGQTRHERARNTKSERPEERQHKPAFSGETRFFDEQYRVVDETTQAKANQEISASRLQPLDDLEATYREKNRVGYKGDVASVTEPL